MPPTPSSGDVYNNAQAAYMDPRTPGVNSVVISWARLQDFSSDWGIRTYNQLASIAYLIGSTTT